MVNEIEGEQREFSTGSIFWILFISIALIGFIYLGIWSFVNNNIKGIAMASIYSIILLSSIVFSQFRIFRLKASWGASCFGFSIGFILFQFIVPFINRFSSSSSSFSFLVVSKSRFLATIQTELPAFWEGVLNFFSIPIAEEAFWLIGMPLLVFWVMNIASKKIPAVGNPILQIIVATIIAAITFGLFHVGVKVIGFLIGAMLFRVILNGLFWADEKMDIFKGITLVAAGMLGAHIGNNWASYGCIETAGTWCSGLLGGLSILTFEFYGYILIVFLSIVFLFALDYFIVDILRINAYRGDT